MQSVAILYTISRQIAVGYDPYPSEYNFKYFTRLQSACSYQGKLQTNYAVLAFCDFKHRVSDVARVIIFLGGADCERRRREPS